MTHDLQKGNMPPTSTYASMTTCKHTAGIWGKSQKFVGGVTPNVLPKARCDFTSRLGDRRLPRNRGRLALWRTAPGTNGSALGVAAPLLMRDGKAPELPCCALLTLASTLLASTLLAQLMPFGGTTLTTFAQFCIKQGYRRV